MLFDYILSISFGQPLISITTIFDIMLACKPYVGVQGNSFVCVFVMISFILKSGFYLFTFLALCSFRIQNLYRCTKL